VDLSDLNPKNERLKRERKKIKIKGALSPKKGVQKRLGTSVKKEKFG